MPCCSPVLTCAGARDRETWIPQRVGPFPFIRGAQAMRGGESKNSALTPEGLPNQPPRLPSGKPVRGGGARPTAEVANEIGSLLCHTILKRVPCLHVSAASVPVRGRVADSAALPQRRRCRQRMGVQLGPPPSSFVLSVDSCFWAPVFCEARRRVLGTGSSLRTRISQEIARRHVAPHERRNLRCAST